MDSAEAVDPRPAATVVVARPAPDGPEVLVLRRARGSRFGPGYIVFPGGSIEPQDADLATRWFGSPEEAPRACAIRELAEEASIVLTADGPRSIERGQDDIAAISSSPPGVSQVPQISRWIAPEFLPVRFDARFFAVAAPEGIEARPDEVEIEAAWWATPAAVLEAHELGTTLMWPTFNTLKDLAQCRTVEEVLALQLSQVPPPVRP